LLTLPWFEGVEREMVKRNRPKYLVWIGIFVILAVLASLGVAEMRTSWLQSHFFTRATHDVTWSVEEGKGPHVIASPEGPYDKRLGYSRIPALVQFLESQGYRVSHQAQVSPQFEKLSSLGVFPLFDEKNQAGLKVYDYKKNLLYDSQYPTRIWAKFDDVPPLVVSTLLYVENRDLLSSERPEQNPAVEWQRLGQAVVGLAEDRVFGGEKRPSGGSTLATQIEKFRHSEDGRTATPADKLQQMMSASLRTYLHGPVTLEWQEELVLTYLNGVPLASIAGFGEVFGIPDGLNAWFGTDFEYASTLLKEASDLLPVSAERLFEQGRIYRQIVNLMLAHRRPTELLTTATDALEEKTDAYLRILERDGMISPALAHAATISRSQIQVAFAPEKLDFSRQKLISALRTHTLEATDVATLYELDRLDATVDTTVDMDVQLAVENMLEGLSNKSTVSDLGVDRFGEGDAADVIYSFTLYERKGAENLLRVQADTLDEPLNINEHVKLDLGSTAKLRTLAAYLDLVETMYGLYRPMTNTERKAITFDPIDSLRQWGLGWLSSHPDGDLKQMLEASMERRFSANPNEAFFTGGGLHRFENFSDKDDHQNPTIREAFKKSINLPFIRVIREVIRFHMFDMPGSDRTILMNEDHPARHEYLARFADFEGTVFLGQFWFKYAGLDQKTAFRKFLRGQKWTPRKLIAAYRVVYPDHDIYTVNAVVNEVYGPVAFSTEEAIFNDVDPAKWPSWNDRAYLAGCHPLELWLLRELGKTPDLTLQSAVDATPELRQEIYSWLFKKNRKSGQDMRIRIMLEQDAFAQLHAQWKRLGYPFDRLVASYATAIGSSADRPDALADLIGIVLNGGLKLPKTRISSIHFAANTPYDTVMKRDPAPPERVLAAETAATLREALLGVVESGTARRINRNRTRDWTIGGKTGTGDHQRYTFGPRGEKLTSVAISRSATFVFFIEDRFYGTMTAFVEGEKADDFTFTSSLPVTIVGHMLPLLDPLVDKPTEIQTPDQPIPH